VNGYGLFTQEAKKFAQGKPISLVDGEKLLNLLSRAPGDTATNRYRISHLKWLISGEICPLCSGRMIRRNGKFGEFLSCERYPDCNGRKKA
jgi:restriction system protein